MSNAEINENRIMKKLTEFLQSDGLFCLDYPDYQDIG